MTHYRFKKTAGNMIVHMILNDSLFDGIVARPPTSIEIELIEARAREIARRKQVLEILKEYTELKESMNVQVTVTDHK